MKNPIAPLRAPNLRHSKLLAKCKPGLALFLLSVVCISCQGQKPDNLELYGTENCLPTTPKELNQAAETQRIREGRYRGKIKDEEFELWVHYVPPTDFAIHPLAFWLFPLQKRDSLESFLKKGQDTQTLISNVCEVMLNDPNSARYYPEHDAVARVMWNSIGTLSYSKSPGGKKISDKWEKMVSPELFMKHLGLEYFIKSVKFAKDGRVEKVQLMETGYFKSKFWNNFFSGPRFEVCLIDEEVDKSGPTFLEAYYATISHFRKARLRGEALCPL